MLLHKPPVMPSLQGLATLQADRARMQGVAGMNYDPAFDLAALRALRDRWPGRLIIKGVVNPLDVESILAVGVDALIVSNHGGRQLDTGWLRWTPYLASCVPSINACLCCWTAVYVVAAMYSRRLLWGRQGCSQAERPVRRAGRRL
ncbi:L-lactate cytochrome reductase [Advenella kashmirensis WT001]|uniref:L-lactate cytochrome reductase n=1 Tax=Advenella kashmirensis (strain DSM 17095 / LMG 22695 / WT001) TaxID=1036672 RepID=I3UG99_ADVKW|nr:L-lactate cytochrome reductase [Advenella kashmirensis WT001]